jgi:hypothetical protein
MSTTTEGRGARHMIRAGREPEPTSRRKATSIISSMRPYESFTYVEGRQLLYMGRAGTHTDADFRFMGVQEDNAGKVVQIDLFRVTPDSHLSQRGAICPIPDGHYIPQRESITFNTYVKYWEGRQ